MYVVDLVLVWEIDGKFKECFVFFCVVDEEGNVMYFVKDGIYWIFGVKEVGVIEIEVDVVDVELKEVVLFEVIDVNV